MRDLPGHRRQTDRMSRSFPEPGSSTDVRALFLRYLDFYRQTVDEKLRGLAPTELRSSRLPSGWSPIELVKHLAFMERRWLVWGYLGEDVDSPWGDAEDHRWHVADDETLDQLLAALHEGGTRTRQIVDTADLSTSAALGGRFVRDGEQPSLVWILFHVLQEYARHAGHLDIVRELADGSTGE
jgi:Protein of unknown function (DUF664)